MVEAAVRDAHSHIEEIEAAAFDQNKQSAALSKIFGESIPRLSRAFDDLSSLLDLESDQRAQMNEIRSAFDLWEQSAQSSLTIGSLETTARSRDLFEKLHTSYHSFKNREIAIRIDLAGAFRSSVAWTCLAGLGLIAALSLTFLSMYRERLRRRSEAERLRTSQALFAEMLDKSQDAIVQIDASQKIIFYNQGAATLFGHSSDQALGLTVDALMPARYAPAHHRNVLNFSLSEENSRWMCERREVVGLRADGTEFPLEASVSKSQQGSELVFTAILRDLTERKKAGEEIRRAHAELETKVRERTGELERANERLRNQIVERLRAEEQIRALEERFRKAFNASPMSIVIASFPDGIIIDVNETFLQNWGLTRDEAIGRTSMDLRMWSDLADRQRMIELLGERGSFRNMEFRFSVSSKNKERIALVSADLIRLGGVDCVLVASQDVTEQKSMEEALRWAELRYRKLFEESPAGIAIIDPETTTLVEFNETACRQLGYSRDEFSGIRIIDIEAAETPDQTRGRVEQLLQEGKLVFETLHRTKQGEIRQVVVTAQTIELSGKIFFLSIFRDITESKLAEDALRSSQKLLNEFQRIAHIGSWELDLKKNILTWSDEIYRIFEIDPERFGASYEAFLDTVHPHDRAAVNRAYADSVANKTPYEITHRLLMPDGRVKFVHERCETFYDEEGNPLRSLGTVQDVTDRKQAELLLEESESRFCQLTAALDEVFWIASPAPDRLIYVSPAFETIWGIPCARLYENRQAWIESIHPDDRPCAQNYIDALKGGEVDKCEAEYRIIRGDGSVRWMHDRGAPIRDEGGRVSLVCGIAMDITESKQTREELQKLSSAVEQTADHVIITDRYGVIEYVNRSFEELTGFTKEEVIGLTPRILKSGRHDPAFYQNLWSEILDGRVFRGVLINRKKNGELFYEQKTITPLRDAHSNITHFVSTGKDVTERRQAEEAQARLQSAVRQAAIEWRHTFDAIETPIIIADIEGRIMRLNKTARDLIDKSYQSILNQLVRNVADGEPWRKAAEMIEEILHKRETISCQISDEASRRSWDIAASLFNSPEFEEERVIVVARETTSMVELQQSLRRNEVMSAMGQMVAGVAHEVRNPLFGISATLDAFEATILLEAEEKIEMKLSRELQNEYLEYIQTLREELERMNSLMQELLEYGKPPSLELSHCRIKDLISQAVALCAPLAKRLRVEIETAQVSIAQMVNVDRRRMIQVFRNLIENAIQHSPAGGTVSVKAEETRAEETRRVVCRIQDSGPGFRPDDLPRLFEPFFTRRRGGTGLGLSIVQRIVEEHKGKISLDNAPGGGAMAAVELPLIGEAG
jgi:PAS domain S-box-containing protein